MFPLPLAPSFAYRLDSSAESQLLARARNGDREAITVLYSRFRDRMVQLAFGVLRDRESAEDTAQEILLRAFDKMPHFHCERDFAAWLYRLALNVSLDRKRTLERRAALWERSPDPPPFERAPNEQIETRLALERALDELDEPARVVLLLREWHELSYEEIAAILGVPLGTVKSRLNDARHKFRRIWEAHHAE